MGISLVIFRLYRIPKNSGDQHLLVKATRPEFPNWSQSAEDDAIEKVERRLSAIVTREAGPSPMDKPVPVATWEAALPADDIFYSSQSGMDLSLWFALDTVHPGYFVFGVHPDEADFWAHIEELSQDREICDISHYARPAQRVKARFVQ